MKKTNYTFAELHTFIKERKFMIHTLRDIEEPLRDLDAQQIYYRMIHTPIEHPEDGYVDGYLLVDSLDGFCFIPFYYEGEVEGICLRQPRPLDEFDHTYLQEVVLKIEEKVKELRFTYEDIKKVKK